MGIGVKWPKKKYWNAPPAALESKNFLGEDPQTPCKKPYYSQFLWHSGCISHRDWRHALFRLFCQNPFWPLNNILNNIYMRMYISFHICVVGFESINEYFTIAIVYNETLVAAVELQTFLCLYAKNLNSSMYYQFNRLS